MPKEKSEKYIESVGRRKTATARVRMTPSTKTEVTVNNSNLTDYFKTEMLRKTVLEALEVPGIAKDFKITALTNGGGMASQAESVRLGIARALVKFNHELRPALKEKGFLMRDPRVKESKKARKKESQKVSSME